MIKRMPGRNDVVAPQREDVLPTNHQIQTPTVFLVDEETNFKGEILFSKALALAESRNMDLVAIAKEQNPPVCRIMNYSQYRYKLIQQKQKNKKTSKALPVKEVQLTPNISSHDYEVRRRKAQEFLSDGHKVRVVMRFRGRALMIQDDVGKEKVQQMATDLVAVSKMEHAPQLDNRKLVMILCPLAIKADPV